MRHRWRNLRLVCTRTCVHELVLLLVRTSSARLAKEHPRKRNIDDGTEGEEHSRADRAGENDWSVRSRTRVARICTEAGGILRLEKRQSACCRSAGVRDVSLSLPLLIPPLNWIQVRHPLIISILEVVTKLTWAVVTLEIVYDEFENVCSAASYLGAEMHQRVRVG